MRLLTFFVLAAGLAASGAHAVTEIRPNLSAWHRAHFHRGVEPVVLRHEHVGLPLSQMAVKHITHREMHRSNIRQMRSGLYLVELGYIPHVVKQAMSDYGLTLKADGSLVDRQGQKAVAFVSGEFGEVRRPHDGEDSNPFPFNCYSFYPWAVYYGGFHRWYDARTYAGTYTFDPNGQCTLESPRTNIEYLQTYAVVGTPSVQTCNNCSAESSRSIWDVGYFWPAHGIPTTYHHAVFKDDAGREYFGRSAQLSW